VQLIELGHVHSVETKYRIMVATESIILKCVSAVLIPAALQEVPTSNFTNTNSKLSLVSFCLGYKNITL
jgi:hypothetical protein